MTKKLLLIPLLMLLVGCGDVSSDASITLCKVNGGEWVDAHYLVAIGEHGITTREYETICILSKTPTIMKVFGEDK